jgi:hypothetical protein
LEASKDAAGEKVVFEDVDLLRCLTKGSNENEFVKVGLTDVDLLRLGEAEEDGGSWLSGTDVVSLYLGGSRRYDGNPLDILKFA